MARGINKVILIGNLGADPEVRYTPNNSAVVTVNIATSSGWKDKQTGENQERTEWHRVVVFGKQAEIFGDRATKGALIFVEGLIRTRDWTDRDGVKRYTTEVTARLVQVLGKREQPVTEPPAADEPPAPQEQEIPEEDIPF